jgi:hypothetical protein
MFFRGICGAIIVALFLASFELWADVNAKDLYRRINAAPDMPKAKLQRAFLIALNRYNPALNPNATHEQYARILEAGEVLNLIPKTSIQIGLQSEKEKVTDAAVKLATVPKEPTPDTRSELSLQQASDQIVARLLWDAHRHRTTDVHLENAAETLRSANSTESGLGQDLQGYTAEQLEAGLRKFLSLTDRALSRVATLDEIFDVANEIEKFPSLREEFLLNAISRIKNEKMQLDIAAISLASFGNPMKLMKLLGVQAKMTVSEVIEVLLRTRVQNRPDHFNDSGKLTYDRGRLLRAIGRVIDGNLSEEIVAAVSEIHRSRWLTRDVRSTAYEILFRLLNNEKISISRRVIMKAIDPELPLIRRSLFRCVSILVRRSGRFFFN